jgi:hypothetical protein
MELLNTAFPLLMNLTIKNIHVKEIVKLKPNITISFTVMIMAIL